MLSIFKKNTAGLMTIGCLLLTPAILISSPSVQSAMAQADDDDDGGGGVSAPVGGVAAGAGGAHDNGFGVLPIATTLCGLALMGTGIMTYRLRK
ncbi:hypothetical protein [Altericista sp. CCNU0014]|uniref:hypothetical protein n=1 Tax=Altericista sp. CCNU0014 TaxID=3082949 RepID=UPI00384D9964